MTLRQIVTLPEPVLRRKAKPITKFDKDLQILIDDMIETMRDAPGVGLAAPQVNILQQLAVIEYPEGEDEDEEEENPQPKPKKLFVIINPEILFMEGAVVEEEGCLSIPEYAENVRRAARVKVRAQDRAGKSFEIEAEGLLAKALQHEIDHLNGLLYIDRLSPLKKSFFKRRYKRTLEEN